MMKQMFPIGYLRCANCGDVALWMVNKIRYSTNDYADKDNVDIKLEYRLVNIKLKNLTSFPEDVCVCDSCCTVIESDNYSQDYLIFFDDDAMVSMQAQ